MIQLPLLAPARRLAVHPARLSVACGDEDGNFYLADLEGLAEAPAPARPAPPEPPRPAGWLARLGLARPGRV